MMDANQYLLQELATAIKAERYPVAINATQTAFNVAGTLDIEPVITEQLQGKIINARFLVRNPQFFPTGIIENLLGFGSTLEEQVAFAVQQFMTTTFSPIVEAFQDWHLEELDFEDRQGVLWHARPGNLMLQGKWDTQPDTNVLLELTKPLLREALPAQKINWLKMYIMRYADNSITGECLLNNEHWPAGWEAVTSYMEGLPPQDSFRALRQFIVFRRCDKFDPQ